MKKITLLLSFVACAFMAQGQNLLVNPSFETWTAGKPDSWTLTTTGTSTQVTTTAPGQSGSALQFAATATTSISQIVLPPAGASSFDTNATYKLSVSYLVTAGDGTDARVWSGLMTSTTAFYAVPTTHADSLLYYIPIHGPGGSLNPASGVFGNDLNGYLLDTRSSGIWHTYNCNVKFPVGITQFSFMVRDYTSSTVIWDNLFFGIDTGTGLSTPSTNFFSAIVSGKSLLVKNVANGSTVEIFNALGAKVQSSELVNGSVGINNLTKGLYIVRVGKNAQKIML